MKFAINSGKIKRFYKRIKDLSTTVDAGILKENKRKEKKIGRYSKQLTNKRTSRSKWNYWSSIGWEIRFARVATLIRNTCGSCSDGWSRISRVQSTDRPSTRRPIYPIYPAIPANALLDGCVQFCRCGGQAYRRRRVSILSEAKR